jgi:hypothetical protein
MNNLGKIIRISLNALFCLIGFLAFISILCVGFFLGLVFLGDFWINHPFWQRFVSPKDNEFVYLFQWAIYLGVRFMLYPYLAYKLLVWFVCFLLRHARQELENLKALWGELRLIKARNIQPVRHPQINPPPPTYRRNQSGGTMTRPPTPIRPTTPTQTTWRPTPRPQVARPTPINQQQNQTPPTQRIPPQAVNNPTPQPVTNSARPTTTPVLPNRPITRPANPARLPRATTSPASPTPQPRPSSSRTTQSKNNLPLKPGDPNPPRIIRVITQNDKQIILAEQKPQVRPTDWNFSINPIDQQLTWMLNGRYNPRKQAYNFTLAFPYIIFLIVLGAERDPIKVYLFYRNQPLLTIEGYLCAPNLLNIFSDYHVCLGKYGALVDELNKIIQKGHDRELMAKLVTIKIVEYFWNSAFNPEYQTNSQFTDWARMNYSELTNLPAWEAASEQNPRFILNKIQWTKRSCGRAIDLINTIT